MSLPHTGFGDHSLAEILSQPRCWGDCLQLLDQTGVIRQAVRQFSSHREWLFVGCGSSYYVAITAAACWNAVAGMRARAVAASELLLFPDMVLAGAENPAAVVISRSGRTSEAVQAAEILQRQKGIPTLAITCAADQPLEKAASSTICLAPADEKSMVMTRSFSSMVLALQYLAANMAENNGLAAELRRLPERASALPGQVHARVRDFVSDHEFADYVCLGQGPLYGLACESALKITEMSVSYAQSFHTLEFRHGPKSIVSPETLILFFISESGYDAECGVLEEVKGLGGTTLTISDRADDRIRKCSDLFIELGLGGPEIAVLAAHMMAAQLLGLYTGLKKGLDPDNPRNLSRVVLLDQG